MHQSHADVNECLIPNISPCPHAQCNNTVGSFVCVCDPGFVSDGENNCIGINLLNFVAINSNFIAFHVIDVDECAISTHNCHIYADCTNTVGSFTCACRKEFYGNGICCNSKLLSWTMFVKNYG